MSQFSAVSLFTIVVVVFYEFQIFSEILKIKKKNFNSKFNFVEIYLEYPNLGLFLTPNGTDGAP